MDNKKVIETIEKKLEVKVEKVLEVKQDGKEVIADVKVGETSCRKVVLKESKNQYGTYYRFVSASEYELKVEAEPKKAEKKSSGKLRTKTEQLCGARRQEIISFAEGAGGAGTAASREVPVQCKAAHYPLQAAEADEGYLSVRCEYRH